MKLVLDTDVVVAALRSPKGASAELLRWARRGRVRLAANVALFVEYEAVLMRPEHLVDLKLSRRDIGHFLDGLSTLVEPVESHFLWRACLRDPDDEMVLEAAINGSADAIVTFNRRDFLGVSEKFELAILLPREALQKVRS